MLSLAARGLGALKDEVVFVGGATIELYLANHPALKVRPTDDVDCVVEVVSRVEYYKIEERLRELGFRHPINERAPICRWHYQGIVVDVMPIEGKILGFTNRWYPEGFKSAVGASLPDGQAIRLFDLPYFLASKVEAFRDRGKNDYAGSTDLEDIVALIDGIPNFQARILRASEEVRSYIQESFNELIGDERFLDYLEGHISPVGRQERVARARSILQALAAP